jgi:streptomycin 6-kinase
MDLADVAARWSLDLGEPYTGGQTATVVRATSPEHGAVALKVIRHHYEDVHEADGLRFWAGDGAVRLLDVATVDEGTSALLLERCEPGTLLRTQPEHVQDEVIAGLLRRLWRPAGAPFRPLGEMCGMWADERMAHSSTLDPGLERDGMHLFRTLDESAPTRVLLCTDLHAGNVVAATREPWLTIDPKPYVGDPHYDVVQHLLNCEERVDADPLGVVGRMASLLDLDRERLRLWLFARAVQQCYSIPWLRDVARAVAP